MKDFHIAPDGGSVRQAVMEALAPFRKNKSPVQQIAQESEGHYRIENIEISKRGFKLHIMGMEFPEEGFVVDEDLHAINISKRLLMEMLKLLPLFSPLLPIFLVLPFKYKIAILEKILSFYNVVSLKAMSQCVFQYSTLTRSAKATKDFSYSFLLNLGFSEQVSSDFSDIFTANINSDQAYRYRISDILSCSTKDKMIKDPQKEIKKLYKIYLEREYFHPNVAEKFSKIVNLILISLYHPKVKKAFISAMKDVKYTQFIPSKADRFWMCVRKKYNFFGKTDKERWLMISHLKVVKPNKIS